MNYLILIRHCSIVLKKGDSSTNSELISKQWCNLDDLMKLSNLGINNAFKLKKEIKILCEEKGYLLPKGLLPMCEVVAFLNINIDYLKSMSNN